MSRQTRWGLALGLTSAVVLTAAAVTTSARAAEPRPTLRMETLAAGPAEDGAGRTVDAPSPVALELHAPAGWPARALDPVLHIGALHFHHYTHTGRHTIRFVATDRALFREGMAVYVQYGDDDDSRTPLQPIGRSR